MQLKNISIKTKLMVYSVLMIGLTALIISIVLYNTSESIIKSQVGNQVGISTRLIIARTDELLKGIQRTALSLAFDSRLKSVMSKSDSNSYEDYKSIIDLTKIIGDIDYLNTNIGDIYLYNTKYKFSISYLAGKWKQTKMIRFINLSPIIF